MLIIISVPLQKLGWIEDYFQRLLFSHQDQIALAMRDGNSRNTDVAYLTAFGNLAG
jgi:hypothetical protein